MNSTDRIAFVGEAMIELTPRANDRKAYGVSPAGDVLNSAIYFKRTPGNEIAARFVTVLGQDPFSTQIAGLAASENIETIGIRKHPKASCGIYSVTTTPEGERSFHYWRDTSAAKSLFSDEQDFKALEDCQVVFVSGITLAIISETARKALLDWVVNAQGDGTRLVFDSNYRPSLWESQDIAKHWIEAFWKACDIALPSVDDEMDLFGEEDTATVLARFSKYGPKAGALKCGAEGCYLLDGSNEQISVEHVDKVVDTTAAGDSFNAGFLAAFLNGASLQHAIATGSALAREVIQHPGAIMEKAAD